MLRKSPAVKLLILSARRPEAKKGERDKKKKTDRVSTSDYIQSENARINCGFEFNVALRPQ